MVMWYPNPWHQIVHTTLKPKTLAIVEAGLIGITSGLAVLVIKYGINWVGTWRIELAYFYPAGLILPLMGGIGGFLAGFLVERVAPETAGSGIPQVKAVLAHVPVALDIRVAVVKLLGGILALGAGLPLGREGPIIQVGAALAAQLSRWFPTSPDHRQQLIAAGAGAGLAASFGTPLASVLFVVEELLRDVSGFTLGTTILASFIASVISRLLGGQGFNFQVTHTGILFSVQEIPFYLILGLLAGLLGTLFVKGIIAGLEIHRQWLNWSLPYRVGLAGLVAGIVMAHLPPMFRDNASVRSLVTSGSASWTEIAIAFTSQFTLVLLAYGSGAPGGLFAPSLILGASLGQLVGGLEASLLGQGMSLTYTLAGMGGFFSAVTRTPITAIVLIFEMTTNFNLVLPLMIVSVSAYFVAERVSSGSLYDHLLRWNGVDLSSNTLSQSWSTLTAADVMQSRVETLSSDLSFAEVVQAFACSHHRGFPVLEAGKLVGIITETDLAHHQVKPQPNTPLKQVMTTQPMTVAPDDSLSHVLFLLSRYQLSRLPVTDGRKLVGIITRADIIRAESDRLTGESTPLGPRAQPSYVVFQTRAPALGKGRLLVPMGNPHTAGLLLSFAFSIARDQHYEVECVHIIPVPRHQFPNETEISTTLSRRLLQKAVRMGKEWGVCVHSQIRIAHDVAQAIQEVIGDRHIDLLVMGWKGNTVTPGRIFGNTVDTLIRQAPCDVIVVKFTALNQLEQGSRPLFGDGHPTNFHPHVPTYHRWLIPISGGPNAQRALQLLPSLLGTSPKAEIKLCQVFPPANELPDLHLLESSISALNQTINNPVMGLPVCGKSVSEAVVDLANKNQCDIIVLGATGQGLLQQAIQGNIPAEIARHSPCTVVLVRSK
ncbi:MAG: chloride channel protein [Synechococcales bacterium]|nr:chloride channel protein [Synechococcales bacterium]